MAFVVRSGNNYRRLLRTSMLGLMFGAVVLLFLTLKGVKVYPSLTGPGFAGRNARDGVTNVTVCSTTIECAQDPTQKAEVPCNELLAPVDRMRSNLIIKKWLPPTCSKSDIRRGAKGCRPPNARAKNWLLKNAKEKLRKHTDAQCDVKLRVRYENVRMSLFDPSTKRTTLSREYRVE